MPLFRAYWGVGEIVIDWGWLITNLKLSAKAREPMTAYKRCSSAAVREQKKQMSHNLILNFKGSRAQGKVKVFTLASLSCQG